MAPPSILRDSEEGSESDIGENNQPEINWEGLGFSLVPTDYMHVMKCAKGEKFSQGTLMRYGNIELSPSAGILNYGQGIFEGLKAYRTEDGRILLFRPEENALRMKIGADRLCMPSPSVEQFVDAVKQTVIANKRWVPPPGKGTLYLRPLLMGTGAALGVAPSPEYTFLIYCSPVGNYHKGGPLNLKVEDKFYRSIAGNGGTGGIKSVTNYAPVYTSTTEAKANGFSDVLFLDSATGKNIEEVTACNIFVVKENAIFTPAIDGAILPGITRKTIIEIAIDLGYKVMERSVSVEEMMNADEVFCTGTAVVVTSVASVTYKETRAEYKTGPETLSEKLRGILVGIQTGCLEDKTRLLHIPDAPPQQMKIVQVKKREDPNVECSGRKCLHCGTDKTPQWRTGPMGPKTLCNACGVRFKSGRLVPEYRPAASPTFVSAKHSNSHRKVLELRRQKEMQRSQHQQLLSHSSIFGVSSNGGDDFINYHHHHCGPEFRHVI